MLTTLVGLIVAIIILGFVFYVLSWAISTVPMPEPFRQIARVAIVLVIVCIVLLYILPRILALAGIST